MTRLQKLESCEARMAINTGRWFISAKETAPLEYLHRDGRFRTFAGDSAYWPDRNSVDLFLDYQTSMERMAEKARTGEPIETKQVKTNPHMTPAQLDAHLREAVRGERASLFKKLSPEDIEAIKRSQDSFEKFRKEITAKKEPRGNSSEQVDGSAADPKGAAGDLKSPMQDIPLQALMPVAEVHRLGTVKYGRRNWTQSQGVEILTYKGAILRHLTQYCDMGEDIDPESGQSHIAHIAASCLILLDAALNGKLIDNRVLVKSREATSLDDTP